LYGVQRDGRLVALAGLPTTQAEPALEHWLTGRFEAATTYDANACPALTDQPAPVTCSEPLPERIRPPLDAM
jgi:hypothetical protein